MKILHTEASTGWGGQEIRILLEGEEMIRRGHSVTLAADPACRLFSEARSRGFRLIPCCFERRRPFRAIGEVMQAIHAEEIGLVVTHSSLDAWLGGLAARLSRRRPSLVRLRHLSTPISRGWFASLSRFLYLQLADHIVTTGEETRRAMIERNRFPQERITSIPTGVDLSRFDPVRVNGSARAHFGIAPSDPVIVIVATLRSWKGHQTLLEALPVVLRKMPRCRLLIAGDGPAWRAISDLVDRLDLRERVIMLGDRSDIPEILASADLLALPSYGHEGVPQAVLQAMAMEKPVVTSPVGSLTEVVADGRNGRLIPPGDSAALAAAILSILHDPEGARRMGQAGRRLVLERYSLSTMIDRVETLYQRLCDRA